MQNGADSSGVRRRRLSDGSRRDETGREDSGRKRKRRILSCDTCRRQKCRCELDEESDACARCRSLRFRSLEASIVDLKATVQALASGSRPDARRTLATGHQGQQPQPQSQPQPNRISVDKYGDGDVDVAKASNNEDVEPADRHVYLSPAEVVRKIGRQLSGGHRRTFEVQADVVSLGLLDDKTARDLLAEFVRRRRHTLLINSEVDLAPRNRDLRHASPFLYDVCCLHAMRFSEDCSSVLHRRIFEHVRLQMGQLMIASPLPLEELTGILIMSLWASAPSGPEYIDSWLLSGHCAQQAMLSINFSEILSRTKSGTSTEGDQRVMRLWANTCLVNLHWAATTSRPATVPAAYLRQCKLLLNFEEVTMRDAMVYAEIMLYMILQDKFSQRLYLGSDGECVELSAWRTRWNYLFELPGASTLRISYSIAWLILARRSLEHDQAAPDQDSLSSSPRLHPVDAAVQDGPHDQLGSQGLPDMAQSRVNSFATDVVRAFVDMPASRAEELPEFHRLCVAYAMLIISKYEQKPAAAKGLPSDADDEVLALLRAAQKHNGVVGNSAPSAIQFGLERALKKVSSRIEGRSSTGHHGISGEGLSSPKVAGIQPPETVAVPTWPQTTQQSQRGIPGQQRGQNPSSFTGETLAPEFDGALSLETMDFFFSGGHLGLGDHSFF
ncbi:hypothetical protein LZ32DRAFT_529363 [Colletotrichum eremochloae]|nr:hypothetical protein LZ32DRAFT_529363 [Colletotrichum eremochloae]